MYEKIKRVICYVLLFTALIFTGCRTTKVVSDISAGTEQYREIQSDIRDGETELAVTSTKIEQTSEQLATGINELEQSITSSTSNEQEIGELLQQIRTREIPSNIILELRNKYPELFIE